MGGGKVQGRKVPQYPKGGGIKTTGQGRNTILSETGAIQKECGDGRSFTGGGGAGSIRSRKVKPVWGVA